MTPPREVTTWDLGAPPDWASLPLDDSPQADTQLAAEAERLAADPRAAKRLTTVLRRLRKKIRDDRHLLVAVWVPDRDASVPEAVLTVDLLVEAEMDAYERAVLASTTSRGVARMRHEVIRTDVPAGPCLIVDEVLSTPLSVEQRLSMVVFIPDTSEALCFDFSTEALHLVDGMALAARDILETLRVETAPGGQR